MLGRVLRGILPGGSLPQPTSARRLEKTAQWPHSWFSSALTGAVGAAGRRCHKQPSHTVGPQSPSGV